MCLFEPQNYILAIAYYAQNNNFWSNRKPSCPQSYKIFFSLSQAIVAQHGGCERRDFTTTLGIFEDSQVFSSVNPSLLNLCRNRTAALSINLSVPAYIIYVLQCTWTTHETSFSRLAFQQTIYDRIEPVAPTGVSSAHVKWGQVSCHYWSLNADFKFQKKSEKLCLKKKHVDHKQGFQAFFENCVLRLAVTYKFQRGSPQPTG